MSTVDRKPRDNVIISTVGLPWEGVPPWPLGSFGEGGIGTAILLPAETTDDELVHVRRLFPETNVRPFPPKTD